MQEGAPWGDMSHRNRHSMAPLAENGPCWALPPKNVTDKALWASQCIWAASGRPPGVLTVRPSRRGQWSDVILAHTHQYSTQPASTSHSCSKKSPSRKKITPPDRLWNRSVRLPHRELLRWQPYFPGPLGRCEWRRRDRRHHVFTLNASRNRHSMALLAENGPCPQKT